MTGVCAHRPAGVDVLGHSGSPSVRRNWADSAPTEVASGRTGVRTKAVIPLRAGIGLTGRSGRPPRIEARLRPNRDRSFLRQTRPRGVSRVQGGRGAATRTMGLYRGLLEKLATFTRLPSPLRAQRRFAGLLALGHRPRLRVFVVSLRRPSRKSRRASPVSASRRSAQPSSEPRPPFD
jgi:hypothetical protein